MMKSFVIALLLLPSLASAAATHSHEPVVGVASLDVYVAGDRIHLLTSSPDIKHRYSDDGGETWSAPIALGKGQPTTIAKRGMDVQIAAAGDKIVAVWPTAGTDKMGRGPMATAISGDGGRTWRAGPNPADDRLTIGHSFI